MAAQPVPPSPETLAMAKRIAEQKDTRTEEQIIADGVRFIMGPGGDEGTRQRQVESVPPSPDAEAERDVLYREYIAARTEAEAVKAERDALRADAERYRWLRAAQSQTARNWIVINNRNMYGEHELDAAIDAARKV